MPPWLINPYGPAERSREGGFLGREIFEGVLNFFGCFPCFYLQNRLKRKATLFWSSESSDFNASILQYIRARTCLELDT